MVRKIGFKWELREGSYLTFQTSVKEDKENYIFPIPKEISDILTKYYGEFPNENELDLFVKQKARLK